MALTGNRGPWMITNSRTRVYFQDLTPDQIEIEDIAHSLARTCRWVGQTREHYSIAQHSVLVARYVYDEAKLHGLMHDAHEAYLGDPSSPLLVSSEDISYGYRIMCSRFDQVIFDKYVVLLFRDEVSLADKVLAATEARDLFGIEDPIEEMGHTAGPMRMRIKPWGFRRSKSEFLSLFHVLTTEEV